MKKLVLLVFVTIVAVPFFAEEIGYTVYQVKEEEPRYVGLQINAEIGCQFRQAEENIAGYEPLSYIPAGFCGDLGLGIRATRWIYIGAGVGAHSEYALKEILHTVPDGHTVTFATYRWVMPVYADVRAYIPTKKNMNPFVEGSAGYYWGLTGNRTTGGVEESFMPQNGLFAQAGVGVDFRRFMVSIGYRYYEKAEYGLPHYGYAKIGVRLGKNVNCDKKVK